MRSQHLCRGFQELHDLCSNDRAMIVRQGFIVENAKYNDVHCSFTFLR